MSILAIILFILFGFFSSDVAVDSPVAAPVCIPGSSGCDIWQPVTIEGVEGVITSDSAAAEFGYSDGWVPTVEQVIEAERALTAEQGELDHYRQYVGFTYDGQQKIYINGFCDVMNGDWQSEPVFVLDGGECFFGAVYNVDTGELESFRFNGDA